LARHERNISGNAHRPLDSSELESLISEGSPSDRKAREDAIACYLSGSDGWDQAAKLLGGTFAAGLVRLSGRKDD
jgi:hypothetical protein